MMIRLLKESCLYSNIYNGNVILDRVVMLVDFDEIPLVTICESPFPRFT